MSAHPSFARVRIAGLALTIALAGESGACRNKSGDEPPKMGSTTDVKPERQTEIENAVRGWVARERGWKPDQYRIAVKAPRDGGATEVVHVVFLEDERTPRKGGGLSVELFLDAKTLAVTGEFRFQ